MRKLVMLSGCVLALLVARTASAQTNVIVNHDGGWCIDAEGGRAVPNARLITYPCNGQANESATIDDRLRVGGLCGQALSMNQGAEIHLQPCANGPVQSMVQRLQNFAWHGGGRIGHNSGYVLAAAGSYFGNRPLCLYPDQGRTDQGWHPGVFVPNYKPNQALPQGTTAVFAPGVQGWAGIVASGGGNIVASGGGNIVASGGGNIIAAKGGL